MVLLIFFVLIEESVDFCIIPNCTNHDGLQFVFVSQKLTENYECLNVHL